MFFHTHIELFQLVNQFTLEKIEQNQWGFFRLLEKMATPRPLPTHQGFVVYILFTLPGMRCDAAGDGTQGHVSGTRGQEFGTPTPWPPSPGVPRHHRRATLSRRPGRAITLCTGQQHSPQAGAAPAVDTGGTRLNAWDYVGVPNSSPGTPSGTPSL